MKKPIITVSVLAVVLLVGVVLYFARAHSLEKPSTDNSAEPTDTVSTTTLKQGDLSQTIGAYGSVTAQPGDIAVSSVPYECRVNRIGVTAGQRLNKGTSLIEIQPSPAARLALAEAQSNLELANKDLIQSQQSFDMKLATSAELVQSQQAVQLAQLRLETLKQQTSGTGPQTLAAYSAGIIYKVDVQQGQIIPAGNPLVETVASEQLEVRLGVEPTAIGQLAVGHEVRLFVSGATDPIAGKIRLITQRVNPDTRLIDIFVTPASRNGLLLDGFIRSEISLSAKTALIAPRNSVLPDDDGLTLFTIKDGKAVRHTVTIAAQNDQEIAVVSSNLHPGDTVVTLGNLELEDGMAVTTDEPQAASGDLFRSDSRIASVSSPRGESK